MNINQIMQQILLDSKVKISEEFDRNFERKAFFDKTWDTTKHPNHRGSLLMRSGALRRSIKSEITPNGVSFSSSLPYASLHNEGGEVVVTDKMKRFFWAMFYKSSGAISTKKDGSASNSKRNLRLNDEAKMYKALALQKVGSKMQVKQRQYIGDHPYIHGFIKEIVEENLKQLKL